MAGYSGTPLAKKLGIKPETRLTVLGAPDGFAIPDLPDGVEARTSARGRADVIVSFHTARAALATPAAGAHARRSTSTAACGSRGPSGRPASPPTSPRTRCARSPCPTGLVDVKVCAIDDTWSGLRLCLRKELSPGRTTAAG